MATRSPDAYTKSLQDGRTVYYKGERVADVTAHPILKTAVEHAALDLDAPRLALQQHRHGDGDRLVHRELIKVGVQQAVRDRVELILLDHHARLAAVQAQQLTSGKRGFQTYIRRLQPGS